MKSLRGGGVQRRTLSLANAFAAAGRRVDIYVVEPGRDSRLLPQVQVREFGGSAEALAAGLAASRPDLLFSTGATLHPVAKRVKKMLSGLPIVIRADSYPDRPIPWRRTKQRLLEPVRRVRRYGWYRAADFIIAVSEEVAEGVRRVAPGVPLTVLPSPIVTSEFSGRLHRGTPDHPWAREDVPLVVGIGRLAIAKDYPTLIRAFALARSRRPLRLVILGDGPERYRRELSQLAATLGVADDVALIGWTEEVPQWLKVASVTVSTSIWEGSPGAIVEALATGCPIVATDAPGDTRRLLEGGKLGRLVPIGDGEAVAAAIEDAIDNPQGAEQRIAAAAPYEEKRATDGYLEAIDGFMQSWRNGRS